MRIDIEQTTATGPASVRVHHGGRSMIWDTSAYSKSSDHKSPMNPQLVFKEINEFWASLPLQSQEKFWEIYLEAREILDSVFDTRDLREALQDVVKKLYDLPEFDGMEHWVRHHSKIRFPSDLKETFEEVQADGLSYQHRKEKTYLKNEYIDLTVMTVQLRAMVPIWSEFIRTTRKDVGANSKELEAFRLLYKSKIHSTAAMARLLLYVQLTTKSFLGSELPATVILNGMGENEVPDWMLATCIVRRLAMCPISVTDDSSNIITNVHQYVKLGVAGAPKKHGKRFNGKVTLKAPGERGEDKAKLSVAEINKMKQQIPDGMRVLLSVYASNPQNVLLRALGITKKGSFEQNTTEYSPEAIAEIKDRLMACIETIKKIPQFEISPHHTTLTQWSLGHVFTAKGVPLLHQSEMLSLIAVAQTALWTWGFYDLAALITAQEYVIDEDELLGAPESRGRIPKELMEALVVKWPHNETSRSKQNARQTNVAAKSVDMLSDIMSRSDWVLHCPKELATHVERFTRGRRMVVPPDIRQSLTYLLLKFEENLKDQTEGL